MSGYIGTQPVPQATQTRDSFTATSGQTSFATGGYTPNFLDVYLNGVKLAAADYTATNGSDVVLASGAATGDILEVVAYTTFTVGSSFTPSIDDNGNAVALTIDSSENVLANTTSTSVIGNGGFAIKPQTGNGTRVDISNAGEAMLLDGSASGPIVAFYGGGTAVGSIGAGGGRLYLGSSDTGIYFDEGVDSIYAYNPSTGQTRDNAIDLGYSTIRYKDLYLSGGVYLGGTGAANKLDDYEEGTWTPSLGGNATYNFQSGFYTKVGRQVTLVFYLDVSSIGTGSTSTITGQPFASTTFAPASGVISRFQNTAGSYVSTSGQIGSSNIVILGKTSASASTSNISPFQNGTAMYMTITYFTS
jgi:hypothetical protein